MVVVRRPGTLLGVLLLALLLHGSSAVAYSGSIVFPLEQGDVLYPQEQASLGSARRLDALLLAARRAGHPVKVAMFTSDTDLGSRPDLYGHPQQTAEALDELLHPRSATDREPLIMVMPAGLAAVNVSGEERGLVRTIPVDLRADADRVVAAAGLAVQAFQRRRGVALPAAFTSGQATGTRKTPARDAAALIAVIAALGVAAGVLSRPRSRTAIP